jgi:hypothetical protein
MLERPNFPGKPKDGNESEFHKCVKNCIDEKKKYWDG